MKNKPFFSKNFKKEKWLDALQSIRLDSTSEDDDELIIVCLQNLYGYRTGLIGYLSTMLTSTLNNYIPSTFVFTTLLNCIFNSKFKCNDLDLFSGIISILNRSIPFFNYGVWDYKQFFSKKLNLFINENHSMNNIFNLYSIFLFQPFFDSGLGILSNKKCSESGFEGLRNPTNKFINEGFLWSYFKDKNILIITLNITENEDNTSDLKELLTLIGKLELKFSNTCEIYISGDFKMNLDECKYLFEDEFKILNNDETQYLLYKNNNILKNPIYSKTKLDEHEDDSIINYNFTKKRNLSPIQKMLSLKKIKYEQELSFYNHHDNELKEIKVISFEESEKKRDDDKINFYKNLRIITDNPISIENYFKKTNSSESISSLAVVDDEWTKVEQVI